MAEKTLKEMTNRVTLQGTLLNNTVANKSDKSGRIYASGEIEIMTSNDCTVPVTVFAYEYKNNGEKNPTYERIAKLIDYPSAKTVGIQKAPHVTLSAGRVENNNFYSQNDQRIVNSWRLSGNFIRAAASDSDPINTFEVQGVISSIKEVIDREGESTGEYDLKLLNVGFGNRVNELTFRFDDPKAIEYINNNYEVGNLVTLYGNVVYEIKERVVEETTGFGEPIKRTYTNTVRLLKITAGTEPKDGEDAGYNLKELQSIVANQNSLITERFNARAQQTIKDVKSSGADLIF